MTHIEHGSYRDIFKYVRMFTLQGGNQYMEKSEARKALERQLQYMPTFVQHNGEMVLLSVDNYEEVTGRKLPE